MFFQYAFFCFQIVFICDMQLKCQSEHKKFPGINILLEMALAYVDFNTQIYIEHKSHAVYQQHNGQCDLYLDFLLMAKIFGDKCKVNKNTIERQAIVPVYFHLMVIRFDLFFVILSSPLFFPIQSLLLLLCMDVVNFSFSFR